MSPTVLLVRICTSEVVVPVSRLGLRLIVVLRKSESLDEKTVSVDLTNECWRFESYC